MGFAVGRHSVAADLKIVQYSRSLLGLVFVVGVVSLKRFFPWPVLTIKSNKIHSVQICHSGAEVGLNHFPFDLTFKV